MNEIECTEIVATKLAGYPTVVVAIAVCYLYQGEMTHETCTDVIEHELDWISYFVATKLSGYPKVVVYNTVCFYTIDLNLLWFIPRGKLLWN